MEPIFPKTISKRANQLWLSGVRKGRTKPVRKERAEAWQPTGEERRITLKDYIPRKRERDAREREMEAREDYERDVYDKFFRHGLTIFQQQQLLADYHQDMSSYLEHSAHFNEHAQQEGWGGMIVGVRFSYVPSGGTAPPTLIDLNVVFPMSEETEGRIDDKVENFDTKDLKPLMARIAKRELGSEWVGLGLQFFENARTIEEEDVLIQRQSDWDVANWEAPSTMRGRPDPGLRRNPDQLLWHGYEEDVDGDAYAFPKLAVPNLPNDTVAMKSIEILSNLPLFYWWSYDDITGEFRVRRINHRVLRDEHIAPLGANVASREISVIADAEETQDFLSLFT